MKKQILSEELKRMRQLAGLPINESLLDLFSSKKNEPNTFSEYSDDALTDMIINLSRFQGNEEDIKDIKIELARRQKEGRVNLKDMEVGETIKINKPEDLAPFYLKLDSSGQAVSDLPELKGMVFAYNGVSISRLR